MGVLFSNEYKKDLQRFYFPKDNTKSMTVGDRFVFSVWVNVEFKGDTSNRGRFDVMYFVTSNRD